jgi:putative ABC transport system permease protein
MRTFMTAFGVSWGIFMLIVMMGSGRGLKNSVYEDFQDFATNSAFIWTKQTTVPYKGLPRGRNWLFNNSDMEAVQKNIPEVGEMAPRLMPWSDISVVRGLKTSTVNVFGDYPSFFRIDPVTMLSGRSINEMDIRDNRKVVMIGKRVKDELFNRDEDPIGQYIRIQGVYFQVVGLFEPKNKNVSFGGDKEMAVFVPFTSMQIAYNLGDQVHLLAVTANNKIPVSVVEKKVMALLAERNKVAPEDEQAFNHVNLEEEFGQMNGLFAGIDALIWIVGIGTLFAGVIGVSNIMLIVVKERTKEIGVQRSIGATPWRVVSQIIMESVVLTSIAGMIGLIFGVGLLELINYLMIRSGTQSEMFKNPGVDFSIAVTSLLILVLAGIFAGLIPARKAVGIKPVEALRAD